MKWLQTFKRIAIVSGVGIATFGCGSSGGDAGSDGNSSSAGAGGHPSASGSSGDPLPTAGSATSNGGAAGNGGTPSSGGTPSAGAAAGGKGSAGAPAGGTNPTAGGAPSGDNCTIGAWPAADPTATGPYGVVTENEVGPEAGVADEDTGMVPKFTVFRPKDLSPGGLCHPIITWGNGTGSTPSLYKSLLSLFASHGFVVVGSNSKNVGQGDPQPMLVGVTWILEQNEDPSSPLYHHLDPTHIAATGHSQGAFATCKAAADERITTSVPIEGSQVQRKLHGPTMFFCGGLDDVVGCDGAKSAIDAVTTLPAIYAEYLSVDHGSWLSFGNKPSVVYGAVTAWMRIHLMADDALRPWFYGPTCQLCSDSGWTIEQKNMDL